MKSREYILKKWCVCQRKRANDGNSHRLPLLIGPPLPSFFPYLSLLSSWHNPDLRRLPLLLTACGLLLLFDAYDYYYRLASSGGFHRHKKSILPYLYIYIYM